MAVPSTDAVAARSAPWAHAVHVKPALVASILISLAVHAGLMALTRGGSIRLGDDDSHRQRVAVVMYVRTTAPVPPAAPAPTATVESPPPLPPRGYDTMAAAPSPIPPSPVTTVPMERPVEVPPQATTTTTTTTTDGGVVYVPRALLSEVPEPTQPLYIPYPLDAPLGGPFTTVLALFIDESGTVRRVRLDGALLPPALDAAARDAFLNGRWQPGRVEGRLVKSLIRVEVTFESGQATQTSRPLD